MTDDRFLDPMRRDPDPKFARELRASLRESERPAPARAFPIAPALAMAAAAAVVTSLFLFPSVRVSAEALLDLFRVRNFAPVRVDEDRLQLLRSKDLGLESMLANHVEKLKEPGPPLRVASPQAAAGPAGMTVSVPTLLPRDLALDSVCVGAEAEARLTVDAARLRSLLETLDIRDLKVPGSLDGARVEVHTHPVVVQRYRHERWVLTLVQARSPEVSLPTGVDLAQLGEMGMRILGVEPAQARRLAQSLDWHTTLLVPVPSNATEFRGVQVRGHNGLLITTAPSAEGTNRPGREGVIVMWSDADRVYGLIGNLPGREMMEIAESVQ